MNGHVRPQVVLMEGPLKKRGATMPVMRDRYCVATYEAPQSPTERHGHGVVLKTYKTHDDYIKHPQKPNEVYTLKCVGEWDGKGNFHKYPFPFLLETTESKLVLCAAPTLQDKRLWMALMDQVVDAPVRHSTDDEQLHKRVTDPNVLFAAEDDDDDFGKAAAAAVQHARSLEKLEIGDAADELNSEDSDDGAQDSNSDVDRVVPVSPLPLSPPNDKLLFRAESTESLTAANDEHAEANEPADWGMYGDNGDANGPSRYDVVDGPTLSLETDLLATKAAAPLASDAFLFDQNGPTFGAVVVPTSSTVDSNSDDFVDPVLQERLMREEHEKQRERVTKKLESNRDLYAEMAAARLKSMRKDAKTKPRRQEHEDDGHGDDWSDHEADDADRSRADTATSSMHDAPMTAFELEEIESDDETQVKRQSSSKKKKSKAPAAEEFLFGEASAPVSQVEASGASADADAEEAEERRIRREKRRLKRQQDEAEAAKLEEVERARSRTVSVVSSQPEEPVRRSSMDDQWQRTAETQKRKEERRRLRKEKARREAEAAAAAEELARQHREEMRRLEEEELKQERLEKRERKKSKENALDKKAKELKKKEAELLAEAEKLKQAQETMFKANEIKDVMRKTKRRDKYTSPTERIQRRDKEVEAMASTTTTTTETDVSTALVVVDEPPPLIPVEMVSTATETETEAATVEEVATPTVAIQVPATAAPAPAVASPPKSAPVVLPSSEPVVPPVVESAPTSQPGLLPAGFPGTAPPSYAAPMTFAAPFSAVHYSPGFAAMPYAGGVAMPTPYYPHLGYVGGIAPMNPTAQMQAYAMMQPSSNGASTVEEPEAFIGPQLPSPKNSTDDVVQGPAPAPTRAPTSSASSLPDLPDVATF